MPTAPSTKWDWEITNKTTFWSHSLQELWAYRHLLVGLVRRYFLLNYNQTVLGPLWILFQPILTLLTYVLVFNKLVGISTGALPPVVFYASGIVLWNFFSDSFTGTSNTFRENIQLFSKVYFPRIIMPLSIVSTQFLRFFIQLGMFIVVILYYSLATDFAFTWSWSLLLLPVAVALVGLFGLGLGLLFSVLTAKYRDITNLVSLGVRLLMFITPVIYPLTVIPEKLRWVVQLNPLTPLFELFRLSMLGQGLVTPGQLLYSLVITLVLLFSAILFFNKQGDKLIDVV
ncbi:ABC transporter [Rufibacter sp. DG15C]|uniref:ABC transporter permease n=1 Tax=Rufibacter sp. DG15C TaxID=1379909 RepID=UPI00078EB0E3|nr:ABC transporter permease [Rufibacter sp. DG15C]AMM51707.1 ABC transporter [Rufibacter sp. DG15C]